MLYSFRPGSLIRLLAIKSIWPHKHHTYIHTCTYLGVVDQDMLIRYLNTSCYIYQQFNCQIKMSHTHTHTIPNLSKMQSPTNYPRLLMRSEAARYTVVCLCVCVCVRVLQPLNDKLSASKSFYWLLVTFSWIAICGFAKQCFVLELQLGLLTFQNSVKHNLSMDQECCYSTQQLCLEAQPHEGYGKADCVCVCSSCNCSMVVEN